MSQTLVRYSKVVEIVGDLLKVLVPPPASEGGERVAFGDLGLVEDPSGFKSMARVIRLEGELVSLQVFSGTKGLSTEASVRFLGHPMRRDLFPQYPGPRLPRRRYALRYRARVSPRIPGSRSTAPRPTRRDAPSPPRWCAPTCR